jgi:hypothetical protein
MELVFHAPEALSNIVEYLHRSDRQDSKARDSGDPSIHHTGGLIYKVAEYAGLYGQRWQYFAQTDIELE